MTSKHPQNILLRGRIYDLSTPLIMAIINATCDSFYAPSRFISDDSLRRAVNSAVSQGADILDIGGCSTRPDSTPVTEDEELERVAHTLLIIKEVAGDTPTSIDTFRASVARLAVQEYGCDIVNDISGFAMDSDLLNAVIELQKPYILTHNPIKNDNCCADNVEKVPENIPEDKFIASVLQFFAAKINTLRNSGFDNDIIIDPGFGFSKSIGQNFSLLRNLSLLKCFHEPILAGISRKSMVYQTLNKTPEDALNGTTVLSTFALLNGANILRVHDVSEAVEVRKLLSLL